MSAEYVVWRGTERLCTVKSKADADTVAKVMGGYVEMVTYTRI